MSSTLVNSGATQAPAISVTASKLLGHEPGTNGGAMLGFISGTVGLEADSHTHVTDANIGAHGAAFVLVLALAGSEQQRRAESRRCAAHDEADARNRAQAIVAVYLVVGRRFTLIV